MITSDSEGLADHVGLPTWVRVASVWRRLVGYAIDQAVVLLPVVVLMLAIGVRFGNVRENALQINIIFVSVNFSYQFLMVGLWGRTLGKFAVGTRVIRADTGDEVLWYSSAIRALVPLAAGVIPKIGQLLNVFIYVPALVDGRRRGLHDRAAGTIVALQAAQ